MSNLLKFPAQPVTKLDYALAYAKIGWHVLPLFWINEKGACSCNKPDCKSPGKHPHGLLAASGQHSATTDENVIRRWWERIPNCNIGIHLIKSGIVAVDIDPRNGGIESIDDLEDKYGSIVSDVMQFSGGKGEHRLFYCDYNLNLKKTLAPGIDLIYENLLVVEPSNHISGGVYQWEASSNPLEGAIPSPFPSFLRDISIKPTVSVSTRSPGDCSGTVFVTESQIEDIKSALFHIGNPDSDWDTWLKYGLILKTISIDGFGIWDEWAALSNKYDLATQIKGWRSFKPNGSLNYQSIISDAQALGWINPLSGGGNLVFEPKIIPIEAIWTKPDVPLPDTDYLPGILGVIQDYYNECSPVPQPGLSKQTALAFGAGIYGRKVKTIYDDFSSLFFANLALSSSGKETIKWVLESLLMACGKHKLMGASSFTSDTAVYAALKSGPCKISVTDEFGLYLSSSNHKANFIGSTANRVLMECVGRTNGVMRSKQYALSDSIEIHYPALTLVALTTPSSFYENLTLSMIQTGFLGRFILHNSRMPRKAAIRRKKPPVPQSIIEHVAAFESRFTGNMNIDTLESNPIINDSSFALLDVSYKCEEKLFEFRESMVNAIDNLDSEGTDACLGRYGEFAGRLGLNFALSIDPLANCVSMESTLHGINYMQERADEMVHEVSYNLVGSQFQVNCEKVLSQIRKSGEKGLTEREVNRANKTFSTKEIRDILNKLVESSEIDLRKIEGLGRPRVSFTALKEMAV